MADHKIRNDLINAMLDDETEDNLLGSAGDF